VETVRYTAKATAALCCSPPNMMRRLLMIGMMMVVLCSVSALASVTADAVRVLHTSDRGLRGRRMRFPTGVRCVCALILNSSV
jgi:hypothetical protein